MSRIYSQSNYSNSTTKKAKQNVGPAISNQFTFQKDVKLINVVIAFRRRSAPKFNASIDGNNTGKWVKFKSLS